MRTLESHYLQLESHIAKVNVQLKDEYLMYANYER